MRNIPRILILTMCSGEQEYQQCCESIKMQRGELCIHHETISGYGAKKAHSILYHRIMETKEQYDLFLKIDADMVFMSGDAVRTIVAYFAEKKELDHLEMAVQDFFSGNLIMGAHAYSPRVSWEATDETLFLDPRPSIPGLYERLWGPPAPLICHAPNPSPFQAFQFGVHRALKVWQANRKSKDIGHSFYQFKTLRSVWRNWQQTGDVRLGLVLAGSESVRKGLLSVSHPDKEQRSIVKYFGLIANPTASDCVMESIYGANTGWLHWVRRVGVSRIAAHAVTKISKAPYKLLRVLNNRSWGARRRGT